MPGCHVMARPARCRRCTDMGTQPQKRMDDAALRTFIRQQIATHSAASVPFAWQEGGLDFFRRIVALQKRYAKKRIENTFHTDGSSLDDELCRFFHEHGWRVSLSMNVPAVAQDIRHVNRSDQSSHQHALNAVQWLAKYSVAFSVNCVVNHRNSQQPLHLYLSLRALGTPFVHFVPLVEQDPQGHLTPESVSAAAWGHFLTTVFDYWVREDIGRVYIPLFDETLDVWSGYPLHLCSCSETRDRTFAPHANGDTASVYSDNHLGNPIITVNASDDAATGGPHQTSLLSEACRRCDMLPFCQGDCPKHRVVQGKSALCDGYYHFFSYSGPYMRVMRDLRKQRHSPMSLCAFLQHC